MIARNYWSHENPEGDTWTTINEIIPDYSAAGENLSRGNYTDDQVINAWLNSPAHKKVMLNPVYTDVGFALCDIGKRNIVVRHLIAKY